MAQRIDENQAVKQAGLGHRGGSKTVPMIPGMTPLLPHDEPASGKEASGDDSIPSLNPPLTAFPKVVPFTALARCGDEVWIENDGQIYRLRRTRQGKLILTK